MTQTKLDGPYQLSYDIVTTFLRSGRRGVYALGERKSADRFLICYVGASYSDLRSDLLDRIGTASMFKLQFAHRADEVFLRHCELFHRFQPNGNFVHPERPAGSGATCPYCSIVPRPQPVHAQRR